LQPHLALESSETKKGRAGGGRENLPKGEKNSVEKTKKKPAHDQSYDEQQRIGIREKINADWIDLRYKRQSRGEI